MSQRDFGLLVKDQVKKCAYKLGCDENDVDVSYQDLPEISHIHKGKTIYKKRGQKINIPDA